MPILCLALYPFHSFYQCVWEVVYMLCWTFLPTFIASASLGQFDLMKAVNTEQILFWPHKET